MALAKKKEDMSDERIYARVNSKVKQHIQHAADLKGLDLTSYVISTLVADADQTIRQNEVMELSQRDREAFARALLDPPSANEDLIAAAKRFKKRIGK
ncbi:MAG: DUF1778 domain-containing protein [Candidatus Obscuribacterales bacterium]|jgi:uncharacterized protein (DUF1778 family)|nr:DUF1778 domain-containing protein [Candidatus Obscuribacterales bacterium]